MFECRRIEYARLAYGECVCKKGWTAGGAGAIYRMLLLMRQALELHIYNVVVWYIVRAQVSIQRNISIHIWSENAAKCSQCVM